MRLAQKLAVVLLFSAVLSGGGVFGQSKLFTSYTKADGLPSDYVMRIYQSPGGMMWFGTERGAAMYDGQSFTTYTTEDGLPHNLVYDILEDAQGRTWFATAIPALSYLKNGKIHRYRDSVGSKNPISTLAIDRNQRILFRFHDGIGVLNGEAYEFHPSSSSVSKESNFERMFDGRIALSDGLHILATRFDSGTDLRFDTLYSSSTHNSFTVVRQAHDSTFYVTMNHGLSRFRLIDNRFVEIENHQRPFFTTMSVNGDSQGHRILLGTRYNGLFSLHNGELSQVTTSTGSIRNFISHQFVDYEGNLWVAHFGQGVEKITSWIATVYNEESGLKERNVWRVATHRGYPLAMGVAGIQRIRNHRAEPMPGLPESIRTIRGVQFSEDKLYLGTISNLYVYRYDPIRDLAGSLLQVYDMGDGINDMKLALDGSIWVATAGMKLIRVLADGSTIEYPVYNGVERVEAAGSAMWFLTSTEGALRFENETFRTYSKESGELPSNTVWSVHEDRNVILIGTSAGLTRITPDGLRKNYSSNDGLIGSPVIGLFPTRLDNTGVPSYWVVTPNHLHQLKADRLFKENSLAALSEIMSGAHWIEHTEDHTQLIMGTGSGLVLYDLTKSGRSIPPPKAAIHAVTIQSTRYLSETPGGIRHQSSSATLEFDFAGFSFVKESETTFSYRLVGVDKGWSTPQKSRKVLYVNVPPGSYEFQVRAVNIDGIASSEPAVLSVTITPPIWMHPASLTIAFVLFVALVWMGWKARLRTIRADIQKRNEQKQFEAIQRIGASISHDIKNTVFGLSLLAKNLEKRFDNPEFRKDAIETIESSLNYLSTLVNRLQESPKQPDVAHIDIQLSVLCADVAKRVLSGTDRRIDLDISDSIRIRTNAEAVERILENLMRNAIEATTSVHSVRVTAQQIAEGTEIFVMDDGAGMSADFIRNRLFKPFQSTKSKGLGIGLYSCKELAKAIGATIEVESEPGNGTTFRVRLVSSYP